MNSKSEDYVDNAGCKIFIWNDNVLMEILLYLPAKTLTRFKSVCKNWLSLISSDPFCCLHARCHPKLPPSLILITTSTSKSFYFDPFLKKVAPFNFNIPNPKILSSCNGLMLLQSDHDHYVYNPTTKQSRKLSLTHDGKYPHVVGHSLAFDPSKSSHYKILFLRKRKRNKPSDYQIEIYNSESRSWKLCLEAFTFSPQVFSRPLGVHCNNFIYWPSSSAIPSFDIGKNVIKYLACPNIITSPSHVPFTWSLRLQELNGHLHYCVVELGFTYEAVALWEMQGENDDPQWFFKGRVRRPLSSSVSSPLRILNGLDHIEATCILMARGEGKKMRICSFLDKSCRDVGGLGRQTFDEEDGLEIDCGDVHHFGECLVPV